MLALRAYGCSDIVEFRFSSPAEIAGDQSRRLTSCKCQYLWEPKLKLVHMGQRRAVTASGSS